MENARAGELHNLSYQIMTNAVESLGLKWADNVTYFRDLDDGELITSIDLEEVGAVPRYVHHITPLKVIRALKEMAFDTRLPMSTRIICAETYEKADYGAFTYYFEPDRDDLDDKIIYYAVCFGKDW